MGFTPVNGPLAAGNGGNGSAGLNQTRPRKPARFAVLSEVGPPLKPQPESPTADPEAVTAGAPEVVVPEKKKTRPTNRFKAPLYSELQKKHAANLGSRTHLANVRSAPEVQATDADMVDFAAFLSTIEPIGKGHGIVKVVLPPDYFSKPSTIDWNSIPFRSQRQAINIPPEVDTELGEKYVHALRHFHSKQQKPQEVPALATSRHAVDLYAFHFAVISRGGFITVGRTQTWPFVWDELGVGGNYPKLFHQRLKLFYRRYIAPFDDFLKENGVPLQDLQNPLVYGLSDPDPAFTLPFDITISKLSPAVNNATYCSQKSSGTLLRGLLSHPARHRQGTSAIDLNEKTFWNTMASSTAITHKALMAQDPRTLPRLMQQDGTSNDDKTLLLHDITYSPWCLYSYINEDIEDAPPTAQVGSIFSSTPWLFSGHTTKISLVHDGGPRTWYCVPSEFRAKAESLLLSNAMDPQRLGSQVPVYVADQSRGELVFIFPNALFMNFDHGYNIVESSSFWPVWQGLSSLPRATICVEHLLYNLARSNPSQELLNAVRQDIKDTFQKLSEELAYVKSSGLSVHRHNGSLTATLNSGELRYLLWIEVDGTAYDLKDYQHLNLENGLVVAHSDLEGILGMFSSVLTEPDYGVLTYLKDNWKIGEFAAATTNSIQSLRGVAALLTKKYPQGADWLATMPWTTGEQAREIAERHLLPMPPYPEADSRVVSVIRSTRVVVQGLQSLMKSLEISSITLPAAVEEAENLWKQAQSLGVSVQEMKSVATVLTSLIALLKWISRCSGLNLDNQTQITAEDLQRAIDLVNTVPDQQILDTTRGKRLQHIVQANLIVSNWVAPFKTANGNVDKFVRSELDYVRRLIQAVPLTNDTRNMANGILLASDLVLQTINPQPRLRPRISHVRPLAHFSALLTDAVAAYDNLQRQYPPIPQLLNDLMNNPAITGQISQIFVPFLSLRVVPDDIERMISVVSFSQPPPQAWSVPAFGVPQFTQPMNTPSAIIQPPHVPYQNQPQTVVAQAATQTLGAQLQPGPPIHARFEPGLTSHMPAPSAPGNDHDNNRQREEQ